MNKKAFTLSEVLITLTVLGIIAAITIPTLMTAAQKHGFAASVRKFHSNLSNAVANYMVIYDVSDLRNSPLENASSKIKKAEKAKASKTEKVSIAKKSELQENRDKFIKDNFKVVKECENYYDDGCFAKNYKSINNVYSGRPQGTAMVLADGTVMSIWSESSGDKPLVHVDVNGQKGPNVAGYDYWYMVIFSDGKVSSAWETDDKWYKSNVDLCKESGYGKGCLESLIHNNWVIDW